MAPRVTRDHLDARRREILEAAFRCFSRRGLHGTTMQEIAEEAGLSAGALYRYFDGKEALVEALAARAAERRREALSGLEPGGRAGALADLVVEMMAGLHAGAAETSVRLDVRLWAEGLDHPEVGRTALAAFGSLRGPVAEYVRAERDAGRIREDVDPEAVGRAVVSLMAGLELQRAYEPDLALDAYRGAAHALLAGLGG